MHNSTLRQAMPPFRLDTSREGWLRLTVPWTTARDSIRKSVPEDWGWHHAKTTLMRRVDTCVVHSAPGAARRSRAMFPLVPLAAEHLVAVEKQATNGKADRAMPLVS